MGVYGDNEEAGIDHSNNLVDTTKPLVIHCDALRDGVG